MTADRPGGGQTNFPVAREVPDLGMWRNACRRRGFRVSSLVKWREQRNSCSTPCQVALAPARARRVPIRRSSADTIVLAFA
jgi:hypothetical protein